MTLEELAKRMNFVVTTDADKMSERIEAAEVILREDVPALIAEVKRLRAENEYVRNWFQEHDDDIGLHNASIRLFAMAACCNADCGWEGLYRDCLVSKHNQTLVVCPECHEVVEIMESDNGYW